jgi:hypothetical protein
MLWCQKCYTGLPQLIAEYTDRPSVLKRHLLRCKSDEEVAEPWVSCDACGKWIHQICGLYNERFADKEEGSGLPAPRYECPKCKLEAKALEGRTSVIIKAPRPRGRPPKNPVKAVSPASSDADLAAADDADGAEDADDADGEQGAGTSAPTSPASAGSTHAVVDEAPSAGRGGEKPSSADKGKDGDSSVTASH